MAEEREATTTADLTIRFLGTPIEQFDKLCKEEEMVRITFSCYKVEELDYLLDGTDPMADIAVLEMAYNIFGEY